jgi:hypothetical protein
MAHRIAIHRAHIRRRVRYARGNRGRKDASAAEIDGHIFGLKPRDRLEDARLCFGNRDHAASQPL